jgi:GT2 family glycosyltransferase
VIKTSFLIVFHNGVRYVNPCIDSILAQACSQLEIEIIAVDNGSTDGTAALIFEKYRQVDLVSLKKNIGFSRGNNLAYARSSGQFVCCVNQDVILAEGWLLAGIRALESDDHAVACASNMIMPWVMSREEFKNERFRNRPVQAYGLTTFGFACYEAIYAKKAINTSFVSGGAFLIKRCFLEDEPYLFDPSIFMYAEDLDLTLRIKARRKSILLEPGAVVYHDQEPITGPFNRQVRKLFMVTWNRFAVLSKHLGAYEFIVRFPILVLGVFLKNWFLAIPLWKKVAATPFAISMMITVILSAPYWILRAVRSKNSSS